MRKNILVGTIVVLAFSGISVTNAGNIVFMVEEPVANSKAVGISNIRGWAVSSAGIDYIELSINGRPSIQVPYGGTRKDVGKNYPAYPNSSYSGFSMAYAYSGLNEGNNSFRLTAVDNDGVSKTINRTFNVEKFQKSYFTEEAPFSAYETIPLYIGDDVLLPNISMLGLRYGVTVGWDRGKQNLTVKQTVPASYSAGGQDGSWVGYVYSDTIYSKSDPNRPCGNAEMDITIKNGKITGYVYDVWGFTNVISGSINSNGLLIGGSLRIGEKLVANIDGSMQWNITAGTWVDMGGCSGRWWAYQE